ncbi:hypothetical protein ANN_22326 [Periplaneta americana]|uniref:Uncharacterized protein n=1 Tax=Periplaneta americana TaxID=6978 RepID=A0ABQ8S8M9_PERAM|nr:hypothetical protein ANN_22326 [Periplaneta americana]
MVGLCEGGNKSPGSLKAVNNSICASHALFAPQIGMPLKRNICLLRTLSSILQHGRLQTPAVATWTNSSDCHADGPDRSAGGPPKLLAHSTGLRELYSSDDG